MNYKASDIRIFNGISYIPVVPPQADTETLAATGARLILQHGHPSSVKSEIITAQVGILTAGWVIGIVAMNTPQTTETKPKGWTSIEAGKETIALEPAPLGSISSGTLRTADLLSAFISALEGLMLVNGEHYSRPENREERDRLLNAIGEAQDCFAEDGQGIEGEKFDGADFGFWPVDIDDIKDQVEFVSSKEQEYPPSDFRGEWLHVNDHGNATLYARIADDRDKEIWAVV